MNLDIITSDRPVLTDKVYPFTNENVSSYKKLFDFEDKDVLSVIGSGDQYFASLLYGAKSVDLFDINLMAAYYFALKFAGIKTLSYEEFIEFFVKENYIVNRQTYNRLRSSLPTDVRKYFDKFFQENKDLKDFTFRTSINSKKINYYTGRVVPYFEKNEYYRLKHILKDQSLPKIYIMNLLDLYKYLDKKYDIMLFSNILLYLKMNDTEYTEFLKENYYPHLNENGVIQAYYDWFGEHFNFKLYNIDPVESIECIPGALNYVLTLKR